MLGLIFTLSLCYGGAIVALFNPFVGLLVYVCFSIVKPESMWSWSVPQGNYSRIVAIALVIGWAWKGFGKWQFGRGAVIVLAFAGYWMWTAITIGWAIDREVAVAFVEMLTKIFLPFLVGVTIIDSVQKLTLLAWVIVLSQGYVAYEMNMYYFGGYNRLKEEGFAGLDNNSVAIAFDTCIGMAFFLGLDAKKRWRALTALAAAAFLGHGILLSYSRGGMLGMIIVGAVCFLLLPKQPKHYLMFLAAIVVMARLAGPQVLQRFDSTFADSASRDESAAERLILWGVCWDMMLKNPLGIGADQFGVAVSNYGFRPGKQAHSLWLQSGAEVGFVGLGFLLLFYILCIVKLWPLARGKRATLDPWLPVAARMVIASLIGFMASAQFVSLTTLEVPFYVVLIGANVLKLCSPTSNAYVEHSSGHHVAREQDPLWSATSTAMLPGIGRSKAVVTAS